MGALLREESSFLASIREEIGPFKEHAQKGWSLMPVPDPSRQKSVGMAVDKILPGHGICFVSVSELAKNFNQFKTCVPGQVLGDMFDVFIKASMGKSFGGAVDEKFRKNLIDCLGSSKFNLLWDSFVDSSSDKKNHFGNIIWDATTIHANKFPEFVSSHWKSELQNLAWESIVYLLMYKTGFSVLDSGTENSAKFGAICAYLMYWIPICIRKNPKKEVVFLAR